MSDTTASAPKPTRHAGRAASTALWVVLAACAGAFAGAVATRGTLTAAAFVAALLGAAVIAVTVWRLDYGLIAILFTLPLDRYGRVPGLPGNVTLYQVLLIAALAAWGLRIIAEGRKIVRLSWADVALCSILLAALWSLPHSLSTGVTLFAMARLVFIWLFVLLYSNVLTTEKLLRRTVWAFLITAVVAGAIAIAQQWLGLHFGAVKDYLALGGGVAFSRAGAFFADPNQLGTFMSAAFVVVLAMLVRETKLDTALAELAVAVITGLALVASLSRTAWVGALVGMAVVLLTVPRERRRAVWLTAIVLAVILGSVASPFLVSRLLSSANVSGDTSVATRYYMTQSALAMWRDNPIWGTGLGAFPLAYPAYRLPGALTTILDLHQLPLAFPVEMGIAGLLAEVTFVFCVVALWWRRRERGWTVWEAATLAGLLCVLTQSAFQYYLYFEYLWLMLALGVAATRLARTEEKEA